MENLADRIRKNHNKHFFVTFHFKARLLALLNLVVLWMRYHSISLKPHHFS